MRSIRRIRKHTAKALGRQLANPTVFRALDQAGLSRGERIRLRLVLDDDKTAPHSIRWERLWLPIAGDDWRVAVHPRVAFSRYVPVQSPDGDPPDALAFRLLLAVANPTGLAANQQIDVESEISKFVEEFEHGPLDRRLQVSVLPGRTGISAALQARLTAQNWPLIAGASSVQNISDCLHRSFTAFISWRTATSTRPKASARCCWRTPTAARRRSTTPSCSHG
jgi:hypothetical protein